MAALNIQQMSESQTFSKLDADRILRRAAEIEGSDPDRPLTVDELRSIAGEAGFGRHALERAIAEVQVGAPGIDRQPVQRAGWVVTQLSTIRAIPMEIGPEQLMKAVRLFQPYRDGPANVNLGERRITWRDRRGLRFTLTSGGGITEIRVYVSKVLVRKGKWMGWVNTAADRLESLVFLVASEDSEPSRGG